MIAKEKKQAIINEYGRTPNDTGSPEVQVAVLTARIHSAEEKKADNSTRISMVTACIGTLESKLYSLLFLCIKKNIHDSGLKCKEKVFEFMDCEK